MDKAKKDKKELTVNNDDTPAEKEDILDGKKLHDLYRHTTKLIE